MGGPYPTYSEIRARRIAARREAALRALRRADDLVRAAGGRIVVFGSLAEGGFHERSDVDLALLGLPPEVDTKLEAKVFNIFEDEWFEADVVAERFLSPRLRQRLQDRGRSPATLE
jgi:predicted nucleotidyltransferase